MLSINTNLMAMNAARNLGHGYGKLSTSVQRLSSGLRINNASDDAAGLAIRELMRAEIASLHQGVRNANDAISLIQTADGALAVIDEKLIRMKELAMQAATGTYNSDQRLIIDSEYQAMASEITRIANATKFNGIYLLNGNLSARPEHTAVADWHLSHNGDGMKSTGPLKVHFGPSNNSAEDYYYIQIATATASALGLGAAGTGGTGGGGGIIGRTEAQYVIDNSLISFFPNISWNQVLSGHAGYNWNGTPGELSNSIDPSATANVYSQIVAPGISSHYILVTNRDQELIAIRYDEGNPTSRDYVSHEIVNRPNPGSPGTSTFSASSISTQQLAQEALKTLETAIISKDNIRASLGALQNRLQNTITNLQIQAENLQAAESRISDTDIAVEMTAFVRNQILTQAAVAMLAQANSLPRMAMQLLMG